MTKRKNAEPTPVVNPIFASVLGSEEVLVLNSLFQAGMRPARDPDKRPKKRYAADSRRN